MVATPAGEGQNTEVSCCCGSLTLEETGQANRTTLQGHPFDCVKSGFLLKLSFGIDGKVVYLISFASGTISWTIRLENRVTY